MARSRDKDTLSFARTTARVEAIILEPVHPEQRLNTAKMAGLREYEALGNGFEKEENFRNSTDLLSPIGTKVSTDVTTKKSIFEQKKKLSLFKLNSYTTQNNHFISRIPVNIFTSE